MPNPIAGATEMIAMGAAKTKMPMAAPISLLGCGDSAMPTPAITGMAKATTSEPANQQLKRTNGPVETSPSDTPHAPVKAQSPQAMSCSPVAVSTDPTVDSSSSAAVCAPAATTPTAHAAVIHAAKTDFARSRGNAVVRLEIVTSGMSIEDHGRRTMRRGESSARWISRRRIDEENRLL